MLWDNATFVYTIYLRQQIHQGGDVVGSSAVQTMLQLKSHMTRLGNGKFNLPTLDFPESHIQKKNLEIKCIKLAA